MDNQLINPAALLERLNQKHGATTTRSTRRKKPEWLVNVPARLQNTDRHITTAVFNELLFLYDNYGMTMDAQVRLRRIFSDGLSSNDPSSLTRLIRHHIYARTDLAPVEHILRVYLGAGEYIEGAVAIAQLLGLTDGLRRHMRQSDEVFVETAASLGQDLIYLKARVNNVERRVASRLKNIAVCDMPEPELAAHKQRVKERYGL